MRDDDGLRSRQARRDRVRVNGPATRPGVIEEVLRGDPSPRYRIRWDDGRETIYTSASGALRAEQRPQRPPEPPPRKL
jgi:hypothetical protein